MGCEEGPALSQRPRRANATPNALVELQESAFQRSVGFHTSPARVHNTHSGLANREPRNPTLSSASGAIPEVDAGTIFRLLTVHGVAETDFEASQPPARDPEIGAVIARGCHYCSAIMIDANIRIMLTVVIFDCQATNHRLSRYPFDLSQRAGGSDPCRPARHATGITAAPD
jgi:hypothetical protein